MEILSEINIQSKILKVEKKYNFGFVHFLLGRDFPV